MVPGRVTAGGGAMGGPTVSLALLLVDGDAVLRLRGCMTVVVGVPLRLV